MRPAILVAICAIGFVGSYLGWIAAAADDYDGGVKHVVASVTGVLALIFAVSFVIAAGWGMRRRRHTKRPGRTRDA